MTEIFPGPIRNLPEADIPLEGIKAYLSQADTHQIIFMEFENDVDLPEHSHAAQIGIVLEGKIDLTIDGNQVTYEKVTNITSRKVCCILRKYMPDMRILPFLMNLIATRRNNIITGQYAR